MANQETIEKYSVKYQLTKYVVDFFFRRYLRTQVVGMEKLQKDKTYIFAPNHQGALMDALAILNMKTHWQPVFLARADIFKNPKVANILYFLKILPIFRIRDGYDSLAQNDKIFKKTMEVLHNKNGLVILPEGNHGGFKRLRQLKKGIARIAFQAEETSGGSLDIQIVPIGIDYSDYVKVRSKLLVRVGDPFSIKPYMDLYHQNNALGYNALMDDLAVRMKAEMINIESVDDYDAYMRLLAMFAPRYVKQNKLPRSNNQSFIIEKQLIDVLDDMHNSNAAQYADFIEKLNFCDKTIKQYKLSDHVAPFKYNCRVWLPFKALALIATLPLFIYGFANNLLEIYLPYKVSKSIKDKQFISSIRNIVAMIAILLFYIIQTVLFGLIAENWMLTLGYFVSLPLGLILAYLWRKNFLHFVADCRLAKLIRTQRDTAQKLNQYFTEMYEFMSQRVKC